MLHSSIIELVMLHKRHGSVGVRCGWDLYNARRVGDHDKYQQRTKHSADKSQIKRDQSVQQSKESKTCRVTTATQRHRPH